MKPRRSEGYGFVEAFRCVGIPSRFVSGYQFVDGPSEKYELHTW